MIVSMTVLCIMIVFMMYHYRVNDCAMYHDRVNDSAMYHDRVNDCKGVARC